MSELIKEEAVTDVPVYNYFVTYSSLQLDYNTGKDVATTIQEIVSVSHSIYEKYYSGILSDLPPQEYRKECHVLMLVLLLKRYLEDKRELRELVIHNLICFNSGIKFNC
jgi:hypothetical protein